MFVINSLSTAFSTTQLVLECILAGTGVSYRWYSSNTCVVLDMHSNCCFSYFFDLHREVCNHLFVHQTYLFLFPERALQVIRCAFVG